MTHPAQIAYNNLVLYVRDNPGKNGTQIATGLGWRKDYLYPKLKEAQETGDIIKKGATSNARFYAANHLYLAEGAK